ncbi:polysaccharide biosynthesis/export family protein [Compostibacter hankyongensis]|uniref:Polysaccharide biosynthesis/export family protein n=1 Tax=Compostibacter hankyongensis TaxID=1007089 RepID=A0ABP8G8E8_9BACT
MHIRIFSATTLLFSAGIVSCLELLSCSSTQKVTYFHNLRDSIHVVELQEAPFKEPVIGPDDILVINVNTVDPDATAVINSGNLPNPANGQSTSNSITQQLISGYLVNREGFVELPVLGKVRLSGLTTDQAREVVRHKAEEFFKNPSVTIRFANFRVTVLGEVNRPSSYIIPNERVSVFDAIGYAGDLTLYGKRKNVLLLRKEKNGKTEAVRLNLSNSSLISSPYYYLKQNDILYVQPTRSKVANTDVAWVRNISLLTSIASVLIVLLK